MLFYRLPARPHTTQSEFDITTIDRLPKVDIVYGYANIDRTAYDAFVRAGSEAIINAGTGNANFSDNVLSAIADVRKSGVFIVRASRVGSGAQYRGDSRVAEDEKNGWINADDESPQHAAGADAPVLPRETDRCRSGVPATRQVFDNYRN